MNFLKEEGSFARPPSLDGSDCEYRKTYMNKFIKANDENSWVTYRGSYTSLVMTIKIFMKMLEQPHSYVRELKIHVKKKKKIIKPFTFCWKIDEIFVWINCCIIKNLVINFYCAYCI